MSADRERGGTFTFASLLLASLLLVSAGLLTGASRTSYRSATESMRASALREGAFAGGRWATLKDAGKPLKGTFELVNCKVSVEAQRDAQGKLVVKSRASNGIGEALTLQLHYSAKQELERFEVLPEAR